MSKRYLTQAELQAEAKKIMEGEDTDDEEIQLSGSENEEDIVEVEDVDSDDGNSEGENIPTSQSNQSANQSGRRAISVLDSDDESDDNLPLSSIADHLRYIIVPKNPLMKGKNGHRWTTIEPHRQKRVPTQNIIHFVPGSKGPASLLLTPVSCFKHFFTDNILDKIVLHTNEQIVVKSASYAEKTLTISKTCKEEVIALIGLLIFSGAMKNNHLNAKKMFDPIISGNIYRATMSCDRFLFLLDCLRFDDKQTRIERKKLDPFAPIRDIWDEFIAICRSSYTPSSYTTLDEQLLSFRGRCAFRMFIPNKPAKYGIKLVMLCDVPTKYMIDAEPYLGKGTKTNGLPLSTYYIKKLTMSIHGSNRNVTMDNWFTSISVADEILQAPYKLTLVGTVRKNKAEIPPGNVGNSSTPARNIYFLF
ncbi:hypothetical protein NQ314_019319 [Rhamnusium bicolor]|uniref:PiggyBac transposable element-derived protein domain-containing protein n=1 Tax=Rhamnusium bicolor TaxID=1586634 RepID=A0AAV8WNR8_9CUCU|nr:hypothetical protein NQ314_019319 [Rhamnusium bicolor]